MSPVRFLVVPLLLSLALFAQAAGFSFCMNASATRSGNHSARRGAASRQQRLTGRKNTNVLLARHFFREKLHAIEKKAVPLHSLSRQRDVAQLVAHYVRDVGVGRSSRLIPTEGEDETTSFLAFFHTMKQANTHQHHTHETGNAA